jgi:hypothetical protein
MLNLTKPADDFLSFVAHPLANMFPMIEGTAFEELKRDIAAQGIPEPIRLYQGMILGGRNRHSAAKAEVFREGSAERAINRNRKYRCPPTDGVVASDRLGAATNAALGDSRD